MLIVPGSPLNQTLLCRTHLWGPSTKLSLTYTLNYKMIKCWGPAEKLHAWAVFSCQRSSPLPPTSALPQMTHPPWARHCQSPCCCLSGAPVARARPLRTSKSKTLSRRWSATWRTVLTQGDATACQDQGLHCYVLKHPSVCCSWCQHCFIFTRDTSKCHQMFNIEKCFLCVT